MAVSLKKLENKMESNQKGVWYENSLILLKIRNEDLYKKKYGTFENYLEERWGYSKRHGHRLMNSAEFMQIAYKNMAEKVTEKDKFGHFLKPILPQNEWQIRPLFDKLEHHGQRVKVWAYVVETGEKINAELVQTKVDEFLLSGEVVPDIEYIETEIDLNKKKSQIEKAKAAIEATLKSELKTQPIVKCQDAKEFMSTFEDGSIDLLITDPPYSTDVEDIKAFANNWLPLALKKVKRTGFAFVFIGAYPEEIQAYLNTALPTQILVWEYKNTLGNNPKDRYKLNYQSILFYKMADAGNLNIDITNEQWAVQSINAPDGRQGDRYHAWQKPIEIAERLIRHTTKENDVVVDPFCCTGTFLLAASKLNRFANGGDISKENLEISLQRGCSYAV